MHHFLFLPFCIITRICFPILIWKWPVWTSVHTQNINVDVVFLADFTGALLSSIASECWVHQPPFIHSNFLLFWVTFSAAAAAKTFQLQSAWSQRVSPWQLSLRGSPKMDRDLKCKDSRVSLFTITLLCVDRKASGAAG